MNINIEHLKDTAAYRELATIDAELTRISKELQRLLSPDFDPADLDDGALNLKRSPTAADRIVRLMEDTNELTNRRLKPAEVVGALQAFDEAQREVAQRRVRTVIAMELLGRLEKVKGSLGNALAVSRQQVPATMRDRLVQYGVPPAEIIKMETRYQIDNDAVLNWWRAQIGETVAVAEEPDELDRLNAAEATQGNA